MQPKASITHPAKTTSTSGVWQVFSPIRHRRVNSGNLLPPLLHIGPIPNPPRTVGHFSCLFILLKVFKNLYIEPYKTYFPTFTVTSVCLPLAYLCDMRYNLGIFQDSTWGALLCGAGGGSITSFHPSDTSSLSLKLPNAGLLDWVFFYSFYQHLMWYLFFLFVWLSLLTRT